MFMMVAGTAKSWNIQALLRERAGEGFIELVQANTIYDAFIFSFVSSPVDGRRRWVAAS